MAINQEKTLLFSFNVDQYVADDKKTKLLHYLHGRYNEIATKLGKPTKTVSQFFIENMFGGYDSVCCDDKQIRDLLFINAEAIRQNISTRSILNDKSIKMHKYLEDGTRLPTDFYALAIASPDLTTEELNYLKSLSINLDEYLNQRFDKKDRLYPVECIQTDGGKIVVGCRYSGDEVSCTDNLHYRELKNIKALRGALSMALTHCPYDEMCVNKLKFVDYDMQELKTGYFSGCNRKDAIRSVQLLMEKTDGAIVRDLDLSVEQFDNICLDNEMIPLAIKKQFSTGEVARLSNELRIYFASGRAVTRDEYCVQSITIDDKPYVVVGIKDEIKKNKITERISTLYSYLMSAGRLVGDVDVLYYKDAYGQLLPTSQHYIGTIKKSGYTPNMLDAKFKDLQDTIEAKQIKGYKVVKQKTKKGNYDLYMCALDNMARNTKKSSYLLDKRKALKDLCKTKFGSNFVIKPVSNTYNKKPQTM